MSLSAPHDRQRVLTENNICLYQSSFCLIECQFSDCIVDHVMDLMMRNGVLGTVLCLVGIQNAVDCQLNWKNSKVENKTKTIFSHLPGPF